MGETTKIDRRTFGLLTLAATPLATALARLWPFEAVDWLIVDGPEIGDCDFRVCALCDETGLDDLVFHGLKEPREFYLAADGTSVCEYCTAGYLRENAER